MFLMATVLSLRLFLKPPRFQLVSKDEEEGQREPESHFEKIRGRSGRRPPSSLETDAACAVQVPSLDSANRFVSHVAPITDTMQNKAKRCKQV